MSQDPEDHIDHGVQSNCCQAPVMGGGMCFECGEHCEAEPVNDEPDYHAPTAKEEQAKNDEIYRTLK